MNLPLMVLLVVFALTAARGLRGLRLPIWQIMAGGALVVLLSGQIGPLAALRAINLQVMLFLFAVFVIGQGLVSSGLLYALAYRIFAYARTPQRLVLMLLVGLGAASALLMNDTLAIVGTPLVLKLAREHRINPKLLLLTLAFAITIGSVPSPIGNPQNLLIALHGSARGILQAFPSTLALPTLANLLLAYAVLRLLYRREFAATPLRHEPVAIKDRALARLSAVCVAVLCALIGAKALLAAAGSTWTIGLAPAALLAALPLLVLSPRRLALLREVDWHTLVFFAAMFVLMRSVWNTGVIESWIDHLGLALDAPPTVLLVGVGASQLISNVPLVALYLPLLDHAGAGLPAFMALAAGSTIAGNLLILGAASNVIIIQRAERAGGASLSFAEFARAGIPLTLLNLAVYWAWFAFHA